MSHSLMSLPTEESIARMWQHIDARARNTTRVRTRRGLFVSAGALIGILGIAGGSAFAANDVFQHAPRAVVAVPAHGAGETGLERGQLLSPTFEDFQTLPGFVDGGFASSTSLTIRIVWKGPITDDARRLIAEANARGMIVVLDVQTKRIENFDGVIVEINNALTAAGIDVWTMRPGLDGASVEMAGPKVSSSPEMQQRALDIARGIAPDIRLVFSEWSADDYEITLFNSVSFSR